MQIPNRTFISWLSCSEPILFNTNISVIMKSIEPTTKHKNKPLSRTVFFTVAILGFSRYFSNPIFLRVNPIIPPYINIKFIITHRSKAIGFFSIVSRKRTGTSACSSFMRKILSITCVPRLGFSAKIPLAFYSP